MKPLRIEEMTIEQKIGQLFFARKAKDDEDRAFILDLVRNHSLGGVLDIALAKEIKETADYPILIADDMEKGFRSGTQFPWPQGIAASGSEEMAYEFGRIIAVEARVAGYNINFAPVMDIAMNPGATLVGVRSFGGDAQTVARMSTAMVKGLQENGVIATGKHYPGFGESAVDSHMGMVFLEGDEKSLMARELVPYVCAMKEANLGCVMTGHIMVPQIDPDYPASISPKLVGLIRKIGFEGLVITDSLAMVGLTNFFPMNECCWRAIAAGNDMVIASYRVPARETYEALLNGYQQGKISEARLDAAVTKVLEAQRFTLAESPGLPDPKKHADIGRKAGERAMTAVCRDGFSSSIDKDKKHLFILQVGNAVSDPETGDEYKGRWEFANWEETIRKFFPKSDVVKMSEFPCSKQIQLRLVTTIDYDSIIIVACSRTQYYTGSPRLTHRMISFMDCISPKISAIVLMGNPYAAEDFPVVPRIIFGYGGFHQLERAFQVLRGDLPAKGKLPIPLKLRTDIPPQMAKPGRE